MGSNNRARRAAKQKARAKREHVRPRSQERSSPSSEEAFAWLYGSIELKVSSLLRGMLAGRVKPDEVAERAGWLHRDYAHASDVLGDVVAGYLGRLLEGVLAGGWSPSDLARLVERTEPSWDDALRAGLRDLQQASHAMPEAWRAQVARRPPSRPLHLARLEDLTAALGICALAAGAPLLDASAWQAASRSEEVSQEHPRWQRVRALLAKAESSEFGPEAEALVAKAQELISRYALEHLAERAADGAGGARVAGSPPTTRRLWLLAPYVRPKAALVDAVARANRCRTALSETHGFVIVVGTVRDVDATELLATSLLLQADAELLGPRSVLNGRTTSRSYRQSFLMAYAIRIGERLQQAHDAEVTRSGSAATLLPALREVQEEVDTAFEELVPHTQGRPVNINSGAGYAAGRAAADQAMLDLGDHLSHDSGERPRELPTG